MYAATKMSFQSARRNRTLYLCYFAHLTMHKTVRFYAVTILTDNRETKSIYMAINKFIDLSQFKNHKICERNKFAVGDVDQNSNAKCKTCFLAPKNGRRRTKNADTCCKPDGLTSLVGGNWSKSIRKYDMLIVHQL
jgi:hypothetical protein